MNSLSMVPDSLKTMLTSGVAGMMTTATQPAKFTDVSSISDTTIVIIVIMAIIIEILILMATYKLTGSGLQTLLCLLFGFFYIAFAWLYYGFSGYKFAKKS